MNGKLKSICGNFDRDCKCPLDSSCLVLWYRHVLGTVGTPMLTEDPREGEGYDSMEKYLEKMKKDNRKIRERITGLKACVDV